MILSAVNLAKEERDELAELCVVQDDSELAHGVGGTLTQTQCLSAGELSVDGGHKLLLIDEIRLAQDDQAKALEDLGADIEALFLDLSGALLDAAQ